MRRAAVIFAESRHLDGRVKPGHDATGRFQSIPNRSSQNLSRICVANVYANVVSNAPRRRDEI
jgi:hypothetical protein